MSLPKSDLVFISQKMCLPIVKKGLVRRYRLKPLIIWECTLECLPSQVALLRTRSGIFVKKSIASLVDGKRNICLSRVELLLLSLPLPLLQITLSNLQNFRELYVIMLIKKYEGSYRGAPKNIELFTCCLGILFKNHEAKED